MSGTVALMPSVDEMPWQAAEQVASENLTEATAAERLASRFKGRYAFDHRRHVWMRYVGHGWAVDTTGAIVTDVIAEARRWQLEAATLSDARRKQPVFEWAVKLENHGKIGHVLALVQSQPDIAEPGDRWDRDPLLLQCPNGVLDLRTGLLRDGRPTDRITMSAAVPFNADAQCPLWNRFLQDTFDGDLDLIAFVQRAAGYSLTGLTTEQVFFACYGHSGGNGKGVMFRRFAAVLGDYWRNMPFATIEMNQRSSIPNDLAALDGPRLITSSETNDGIRLNEARVKAITGSDPITARWMHGEFFTFELVGKVWLAFNYKPIIRDDSPAFWRRVRLIPFTRTFPIDPTFEERLSADDAGILRWMVDGCLSWQRDGLCPPACVMDATHEYQDDSDPLAEFFSEACEVDPPAQVGASDLFAHYQTWAQGRGLSPREMLTSNLFGRKVRTRLRNEKTRDGRVYFGIARRYVRLSAHRAVDIRW
jgi:putative DNA primase/helicase